MRMGAAVVAMEIAALAVAYLGFGRVIMVVGAPLLLGTVLVLLVVHLSEAPRRRLDEHRAARWDTSAELPGGLMSGFFEIPAQGGPVDVSGPARSTADR